MMAEPLLGTYGFGIAVYLISIMIAIGGIALGVGYAINEKRFKEFGKKELYESAFNGALVGGLILLFSSHGIVSDLINSAALTNGTRLACSSFLAGNAAICLAYDYLVGIGSFTFMGVTHYSVLSMVTGLLTALFSLDALLGIIAALKINLLFITFSLNYAILPIINEIQYLVKILSTVAISAAVQASVLMFVAVGALSLILPAGIVLRTFYPTRRLGGFLIALGVGLYVVLPLSYVFNLTLANSYYANISTSRIERIALNASSLQSSMLSLNSVTNSTKAAGVIGSISNLASSFINGLSNMINEVIGYVAYFVVYAFVLPIFSLIITGVSVRELAGLLGSEAFFVKFNIL